MKLAMIFTFALCSLAVGCGSSSDDSGPTGPVAAQPLAGTIDGQAFTAKVGLARKGFDEGKKSIDIYDTDVTCEQGASQVKREILIDVPWEAGMTKDFSFSLSGGGQTATFVVDKNGTPDNIVSANGRVEVIDAPTEKGATGKLRLRAIAESNKVEGEVTIKVCE
jgi:hypothetical protein